MCGAIPDGDASLHRAGRALEREARGEVGAAACRRRGDGERCEQDGDHSFASIVQEPLRSPTRSNPCFWYSATAGFSWPTLRLTCA